MNNSQIVSGLVVNCSKICLRSFGEQSLKLPSLSLCLNIGYSSFWSDCQTWQKTYQFIVVVRDENRSCRPQHQQKLNSVLTAANYSECACV